MKLNLKALFTRDIFAHNIAIKRYFDFSQYISIEQHKVCCVFIITYLCWALKSMSEILQYLFIAILCAKMSRVTWALNCASFFNKKYKRRVTELPRLVYECINCIVVHF